MNISREAVDKLLTQKPTAPAVTIYLPTHRASSPPHMSEDQIRLKNLVHKAVEILKTRDDGRELEKQLCNRLEGLLDDKAFWERRTESLLLCARQDVFETFDLPADSEEYVAVDTYFHLAPVFGLLSDARDYYVLAIAQHKPALFSGDMYDVRLTSVELPPTLEAGLNIDEMNQKSEQQRSAGGSTGGYNGRGGAKNPAEAERQRFWRMIDQIVINKTKQQQLPLILAGVESEVAEYRAQSHYPHLFSGSIHGSFGAANPHDLFALARGVVRQELVEPVHKEALETYHRLAGEAPDRTASDIAAITDAAEKGRIDTLLIGMSRYTTDTVRDSNQPELVITFPGSEGSTQALHDIAQTAWRQSSRLINIDADQMPGGAPVAAIMRY